MNMSDLYDPDKMKYRCRFLIDERNRTPREKIVPYPTLEMAQSAVKATFIHGTTERHVEKLENGRWVGVPID